MKAKFANLDAKTKGYDAVMRKATRGHSLSYEDALAYGAYDINDAFEFMKSNGADCPAIIRQVNGCSGIQKMEYKGWRQMHQYGDTVGS